MNKKIKVFIRNPFLGVPYFWDRVMITINKLVYYFSIDFGKRTRMKMHFKCYNYGKKSQVRFGYHCMLDCMILCQEKGKVILGDHVSIGKNSIIECVEKVKIGSRTRISQRVVIRDNNSHPLQISKRRKQSITGEADISFSDSKPIVISEDAWIGFGATIIKGVTIGKGSIVAERAVVTKDVPDYSIVAGFPAKVVRELTPKERK